jgi:thiamine biosynthesis lipoprotein
MIDGREVHHIIDPRTGLSGGAGLASVTVIQADVAWAEVWSKTLFLSSATRIAQLADVQNLAAAWVTVDGTLHVSAAAKSFLVWEASHG